jgi:hypothetical protein
MDPEGNITGNDTVFWNVTSYAENLQTFPRSHDYEISLPSNIAPQNPEKFN